MREKRWVPSEIERRCLDQLSSEEAWKWIGMPRPDEASDITWRPFGKIFAFNVVVFLPVFLVLTIFGWRSLAAEDSSMVLDTPSILTLAAVILVPTLVMAVLVVSIYRRSWNRRARGLRAEEAEFEVRDS
ncbi:hypothetical protein EON81_09580 [bacterium]|nr:MAG: hypothetical protein EON81_09580 [bacterium]